jgi:predicted enzyme involved in methoxymalonyl-ACP biosynthesis
VMSCRAFSRRIEHACLKYLFDKFDVPEVHFRFRSTDRNGPTRELFEYYLNSVEGPLLTLSRERFEEKEPRLFCHLEETNDG